MRQGHRSPSGRDPDAPLGRSRLVWRGTPQERPTRADDPRVEENERARTELAAVLRKMLDAGYWMGDLGWELGTSRQAVYDYQADRAMKVDIRRMRRLVQDVLPGSPNGI